jgi:hypothetical protein
MHELRFDPAHAYLIIVIERDDAFRRRTRKILRDEILGEIALQEDHGTLLQECSGVSGACFRWVGENKSPYGLSGNSLHARHKRFVAARKLPVHQDESVSTQPQQRVTAFPGEHVQPRFHQFRGQAVILPHLVRWQVLGRGGHCPGNDERNDSKHTIRLTAYSSNASLRGLLKIESAIKLRNSWPDHRATNCR